MQVIIDISMYPFTENYETPILEFIERLNAHENVEIETNTLSTQIRGDYDQVMAILTSEMKLTFQNEMKSLFVIKSFRLV